MRAAALLLLCVGASAAADKPRLTARALAAPPPRVEALTPPVERALAGRARQLGVTCIDQTRPLAVRVLDRTAILWEMSPRRWYLNLPPRCAALAPNRIVVTRDGIGRICAGDLFRVVDRDARATVGLCRLGAFVPFLR